MTNRNHTFVANYSGYQIAILALDYENGWTIEVTVSGGDFDLPKWRDHDNCYKDIETARNAGLEWAKARIDENSRKHV